MRIIIQVVKNASVTIDNKLVSEIKRGYLLFVGFSTHDDAEIVYKMCDKLLSLRLFPDENGKTNKSLFDVGGEILSVSQFTLYASLKDGRRPSFIEAKKADEANELYNLFNDCLRKANVKLSTGVFKAMMDVSLINEGPMTIILDSKELFNK